MSVRDEPAQSGGGSTGTMPTPDSDIEEGIKETITFELSDGTVFSPKIVTKVKATLAGQVESIVDNCGRSESRRRGELGWEVSIEGTGFMSDVPTVKKLAKESTVSVAALTVSGEYEVTDVSFTIDEDLGELVIPSTERQGGQRREQAVEFQIQLKDPRVEDDGSMENNVDVQSWSNTRP